MAVRGDHLDLFNQVARPQVDPAGVLARHGNIRRLPQNKKTVPRPRISASENGLRNKAKADCWERRVNRAIPES